MDDLAIKAIVDAIAKPSINFDETKEHGFATLPPGHTIHDIAKYLPPPPRIKQSVNLISVPAFVAYVLRFAEAETTIFANEVDAVYEAVIDYHTPRFKIPGAKSVKDGGPMFDPGLRGHQDHRALYKCPQSLQWLAWTKADNSWFDQTAFAAFLETNLDELARYRESCRRHVPRNRPAAASAQGRGIRVRGETRKRPAALSLPGNDSRHDQSRRHRNPHRVHPQDSGLCRRASVRRASAVSLPDGWRQTRLGVPADAPARCVARCRQARHQTDRRRVERGRALPGPARVDAALCGIPRGTADAGGEHSFLRREGLHPMGNSRLSHDQPVECQPHPLGPAVDLFGSPVKAPDPRGKRKRREPKPAGYYAAPGTGPAGETCKGCMHLYRRRLASTYPKCLKAQHLWTGGRKSDVLVNAPACIGWEKRPAEASGAPGKRKQRGGASARTTAPPA